MRIYGRNEIDFDNNGYGNLKDILSCTCEEYLNGKYDLEFEYKIKGYLSEFILEENIIKVDVGSKSGEEQLFRIKIISKGLKKMRVYCQHIFYDLSDNFLVDIAPTNQNGSGCLNWILERTQYENRFTASSDIADIYSARYVRKNFIEALLTSENAFVTIWGGFLTRNNYHFEINSNIGTNSGVKLIYGKNIKEIKWDIDITGIATRIMPIGYDGLLVPELFIDSPIINNYTGPKIRKIEYPDIAIDEENGITSEIAHERLREAIYKEFENGIDKPLITIDIDFVELSKTVEYKEKYSVMEKVYIGDFVDSEVKHLGLTETMKVIGTTYDVLKKKYIRFILSNKPKPKGSFITNTNTAIREAIAKANTQLDEARKNATNMLINAMGGYVVKTREELYIMDNDNPNEAIKVWRWNLGGLAHSNNGISGPFNLAMTSDGQIVADKITVGSMSIDRITGLADTLNNLSINLEGFIFDINSKGGNNLLLNSVGFAEFQNWLKQGNVSHISNTELISNGSKSGGAFLFNGGTIRQLISVKADDETISQSEKTYYTFSTIIKKGLIGTCYFRIYNDVEEYIIQIPENEEIFYKPYELKGLLPQQSFYYVEIYGSEGSDATFTDNLGNVGTSKIPYIQALNEILNAQVNLNNNGVLVKSSIYKGSYTIMSPLEFAGYADVNGVVARVFSLNGDTTELDKLLAKNQISMPPIKIQPRTTSTKRGWAWIKTT